MDADEKSEKDSGFMSGISDETYLLSHASRVIIHEPRLQLPAMV